MFVRGVAPMLRRGLRTFGAEQLHRHRSGGGDEPVGPHAFRDAGNGSVFRVLFLGTRFWWASKGSQ